MKTYLVTYKGNASRFENISEEIIARNEREAVENVYGQYLDANYFPQEDGTIGDCDGNIIAEKGDTSISYDGGYFSAEEIKLQKVDKNDYKVRRFIGGYYGISLKNEPIGVGLVYGGDSACDDHYDKDYMDEVYRLWNGELVDGKTKLNK